MIPPLIAAKAPNGEKFLFRRLRDDPATRDWVVFHSFDIRRHVSRAEGEADLVVAIPNLGVLCIEVKGCGVTRHDGLWIYGYDPPRKSPVGPFRQASDAAHSLRKHLVARDPILAPVVFFSAVFFTEIDFKERSMEWEPWQSVGKTELLRHPISELLTGILGAAHSKLRSLRPAPTWYGERSLLSGQQIESVVRLMRPDFEYTTVAGGLTLQLAEQSIRKFTEEQFGGLDLIEENPRVLFKGPAGTGKTLLAIEAARRAVRSGRSTALVCFNSLLGGWLKRETTSIAAEAREAGIAFYAGTISALMLGIVRVAVPDDANQRFWSSELPALAVDVLLDDKRGTTPYEMLILDETQDLLTESMLDVLELVVGGGLAAGRWAMFGDLEKQAIFANSDAAPGLDRLKSRTGQNFTTCSLRINCRNSRNIADAVTLASGLSPGYSRVLVDVEAPDVEPLFYRSAKHQGEQLAAAIKRLLRTFDANQIMVLSMRGDKLSCAADTNALLDGIRLVPARETPSGETSIRYSSVHAFKGLEAAAVILTDIESIDDEQARSLLYVGMTRARIALVLLMSDRVRSRYDQLLMEGYRTARREGRS